MLHTPRPPMIYFTVSKTSFCALIFVLLADLCQYIGVRYVRNPDNPECGYIACWDRHPYHMPCAPGLRVHPLFFWGDSYPCTERDTKDQCNYIKNFLPQGNGLGYPVNTDNGRGQTYSVHNNNQVENPARDSYSVNVIPQTEAVSQQQPSLPAQDAATPNDTYVTPNV